MSPRSLWQKLMRQRTGDRESVVLPKVGEIWIIANDAAGVVDTSTEDHPAIVVQCDNQNAGVCVGTSGPGFSGPDAVAVHRDDVITQGSERGLKRTTYFAIGPKRLSHRKLGAFIRCLGRVPASTLSDLRRRRRGINSRGTDGTNP